MHPPIHSIMRKVISDYPVPATVGSPSTEPNASDAFKKANEGREYVVPKGHFVLAAPGFSQMDKSIWGEDAEEFHPERWAEGSKIPGEEDEGEEDYGWGKISKGGKSAYLPFGAGRHRCSEFMFDSQRAQIESADTSVTAAFLQLASNLPMSSSVRLSPPLFARCHGRSIRLSLATTTLCVRMDVLRFVDVRLIFTDSPCLALQTMIVMPLAPRNVTFTKRESK